MKDSPLTVPIQTSAGTFTATFTERGIAALDFPSARRAAQPAVRPDDDLARLVRLTRDALEAVLSGQAPRQLPPLDWTGATEFRRRVWTVLLRIPPGKTLTYAQVAVQLGAARATRAVGGACGANPIPVLVPCHRVVATGGGMGGFSGGLDWKRKLLAVEAGGGSKRS